MRRKKTRGADEIIIKVDERKMSADETKETKETRDADVIA